MTFTIDMVLDFRMRMQDILELLAAS
jgi:hypothetical protein